MVTVNVLTVRWSLCNDANCPFEGCDVETGECRDLCADVECEGARFVTLEPESAWPVEYR